MKRHAIRALEPNTTARISLRFHPGNGSPESPEMRSGTLVSARTKNVGQAQGLCLYDLNHAGRRDAPRGRPLA
jgi:hypothetical protein